MPERYAVPWSREIERVKALPSRDWEPTGEELAARLTAVLKTPSGTMHLFPIQAVALHEIWQNRGLVGPIPVGRGKTLISLLAPLMLQPETVHTARPLLVLPAKLIEKTKRDWAELSKHWRIPRFIEIVSYEWLGRRKAKPWLANVYKPTCIICDEAHKLKRQSTACTRVVKRYLEDAIGRGEHVPFVVLSGTITRTSIKDHAHLDRWALGDGSPLPLQWAVLQDWAAALDEGVSPTARYEPGALAEFCDVPSPSLQELRESFGRRFVSTPGIVSSRGEHDIDVSLRIDPIDPIPSAPIDEAFAILRRDLALPDGWEFAGESAGSQAWEAARQLSLGFYYVLEPRPPYEWSYARSEWISYAREIIKLGKFDTELDVALNYPSSPALAAWRSVRDTFKENRVPVWICDSVLKMARDWLHSHPHGILWVDHIAFGVALEKLSGVRYFRNLGRSKDGIYIEDATGPVIASFDSNRDGRNLQFKWSENLYVACPPGGLEFEQSLGRTHRTGQVADEVVAEIYLGCIEHLNSFWRAVSQSEAMQALEQQPKKLVYADKNIPEDARAFGRGPRWIK